MCNCGQPLKPWKPVAERAAEQAAATGQPAETANDRIQQARHEQQARRSWPATWQGYEHTPAR